MPLPQCPTCGVAMVPRRKRNSEELFWGCPRYPRCAGQKESRPRDGIKTAWKKYEEAQKILQDEKLDVSLRGSVADLQLLVKRIEKGELVLQVDEGQGEKALPKPQVRKAKEEVVATTKNKEAGWKDAAKTTGGVVKDSFKVALKQESAAAAAEGCVELAKRYAGPYWPEFFNTPSGEKVAQLMVPVVLHMLCETFSGTLPMADKGKLVASLAIEGVSKETVSEARKAVMPLMKDLLQLGMSLEIPDLDKSRAQALLDGEPTTVDVKSESKSRAHA